MSATWAIVVPTLPSTIGDQIKQGISSINGFQQLADTVIVVSAVKQGSSSARTDHGIPVRHCDGVLTSPRWSAFSWRPFQEAALPSTFSSAAASQSRAWPDEDGAVTRRAAM